MSIQVVVSSTAAGVSVSGGTAVAITVGSTSASVPVTVGGGIGPAGFVVAQGTATNAFGTFQLSAGNGITISTSVGQFQISSYGTNAVGSLAPVQSVAGRVGAVQLQASDVTAGTFSIARIPTNGYTALSGVPTAFAAASHTHDASDVAAGTLSIARIPTISYTALSNAPSTFSPAAHTHSTSDVVSFTAAAAAAAPVQNVAGRTGAISLAATDVAGLASVATSGSYTSLQNVPATFAPSAHTHSTADIAGITASFAAAGHTHNASAITSGVLELARIPTIGYTALSGVPATFAPSAHTHGTADVVGLTASFSQVGHSHDYVRILNGLTGTVTIAGGSGVTVSTASSSITISAGGGGGGGSANIVEAATAAGFPATGASGTLYISTDVSRVHRFDASGVYVEIGTAGGTGTDPDLRALFVPGAPTIAPATPGNAQATLSWTAPAALSVLPITGYVVEYGPPGGARSPVNTGSAATTYTKTGLTNGIELEFRVAAINALGQGAWSAFTRVTPLAGVIEVSTAGSGSGSWSGAGTQASPFVRSAVGWTNDGNWSVDPVFTARGSGSVYIAWASRTQSGSANPSLYVEKNGSEVQVLAWSTSGASITPVSVIFGDTVRLATDSNGQQLTTVSVWIQ